MPGKSTKFDRCVEGVKQNSPDIDTPEAVCVSRGVEPSSWKKSIPTEMIKFDKNGQWSLEKIKTWEPKDTGPKVMDLAEEIKNDNVRAVISHDNKESVRRFMDKKKTLKKSNEIELFFYNDNSIDIEYNRNVSVDVLNKAFSYLESLGYEDLEKKEWSPKAKHKSKSGGLTQEGVESYRRANPGSKLKTAVTENNPKGKRAKRRKSFCARNKGQIDMHNIDCKKTPEKRACLARKKWKC